MTLKPVFWMLLLPAALLMSCKTRVSNAVLKDVKANGIIFRLHDYQAKMAALRERGQAKEADEQQRELDLYNRALVRFFREEFDACPVYFFYAGQTEALRQRRPVLLDDALRPAPDIALPTKIYIADFQSHNPEPAESTRHAKFFVEGTPIEINPVLRWPWKARQDRLRPQDVAKFSRKLKSGQVSSFEK